LLFSSPAKAIFNANAVEDVDIFHDMVPSQVGRMSGLHLSAELLPTRDAELVFHASISRVHDNQGFGLLAVSQFFLRFLYGLKNV